jgi:hypothetical protein
MEWKITYKEAKMKMRWLSFLVKLNHEESFDWAPGIEHSYQGLELAQEKKLQVKLKLRVDSKSFACMLKSRVESNLLHVLGFQKW